MNKYFVILLIVLGFSACTPENHYERAIRFKNSNWIKFNELKYDIPLEAGKSYSYDAILIVDSTYHQRKIKLGFYLEFPSGETRLLDKTVRLLDNEFQSLGEKTDVGYQYEIAFRKHLKTNETGILKAEVVLHSQYYDNYGIIGFDLFVKED